MQTIDLQEDLASIGIGCCIDNLSDAVESPIMRIEYKQQSPSPHPNDTSGTKHQRETSTTPPPPRRRTSITSRMSNGLRRSSKDLMSSFTKSLPSSPAIKKRPPKKADGSSDDVGHQTIPSTTTECDNNNNTGHQISLSPQSISASEAAKLVAAEFYATESMDIGHKQFDELVTLPSLLDASHLVVKGGVQSNDDEEEDVRTRNSVNSCASTARSSPPPSEEETLGLEVGHSAQEYLEECFYTEVNVLNRQKFNDIPEFSKSDFTIKRHLGKGSYSDVFEVVDDDSQALTPAHHGTSGASLAALQRRPSRGSRRATHANSITVATLSRPIPVSDRKRVLAMKCLRPQIRSDVDQFTIGAEDLVHETAILANLSHPNIIKLYGRSSGSLTNAFRTNDGYFILLDKLDETLHDRIEMWKRPDSFGGIPTSEQIDVAHTISRAMCYLHSKKIMFRDLKPDNVGFDSNGVLKLFDFGFAIGLPEKKCHSRNGIVEPGKIFDRCGTPRYMSPENGLHKGYTLSADVYSFGILLWEICALAKPFASFKSATHFEAAVFEGGERPLVDPSWPKHIRHLMIKCWSTDATARPSIIDVVSTLSLPLSNGNGTNTQGPSQPNLKRRTNQTRRRMSASIVGW